MKQFFAEKVGDEWCVKLWDRDMEAAQVIAVCPNQTLAFMVTDYMEAAEAFKVSNAYSVAAMKKVKGDHR